MAEKPHEGKKKHKVADRRRQASQMILEGKGVIETSEALGVSRVTVWKYLKAIEEEWRNTNKANYEERLNQQLAKLELVADEAFAAFQRSIGEVTKTTEKVNEDGETTETTVTETRAGDTSLLDVYRKAVMDQAALLGLKRDRFPEENVDKVSVVLMLPSNNRGDDSEFDSVETVDGTIVNRDDVEIDPMFGGGGG